MRRALAAAAAAALCAGCAAAPQGSTSAGSPAPGTPAASAPDVASPAGPSSGTPPVASASPTAPTAPVASATASASDLPAPAPTAADSLEAAFAEPEAGGIGAFLRRHPDYLPGTVTLGDAIVSGAVRGPVEITLKNVPAGTTRMFLAIACTAPVAYRVELAKADGTVLGASWNDSCGYWGGLNGYTTVPFVATDPPVRLTVTVAADTRYSYVLYAGR